MSKTEVEQPSQLSNSMSRTSFFIQENKKSLLVIGGTVIGLILLFFAYQKFYLAPRETEAVN